MPEIIVEGTPRSLQGSRRGLTDWMAHVRAAAERAYPEREERLDFVDVSARILHFCFDWGDTDGDLDNIAKPILDALAGILFFNDSQIKELVLRRTDLQARALTTIDRATPLLAERIDRALRTSDGSGFVYVAVGTDADHGIMP